MLSFTSPLNIYMARLNAFKASTDDKYVRELEKKEQLLEDRVIRLINDI